MPKVQQCRWRRQFKDLVVRSVDVVSHADAVTGHVNIEHRSSPPSIVSLAAKVRPGLGKKYGAS